MTYFEIVERKGIGHPDTICDEIANNIAKALHYNYLETDKRIHHYNMDKALLVAGKCYVDWETVNKFDEPMKLYIGDRITKSKKFNINNLVEGVSRKWFEDNILLYTPDILKVINVAKKGSPSLTTAFEHKAFPKANDTSATVGYAPFTNLEKTIVGFEDFLYRYRQTGHDEIGMDTKVMCVKDDCEYSITIAAAIVAKYVYGIEDYQEKIKQFKDSCENFFYRNLTKITGLDLKVNTLDTFEKGKESVYLTNIGLSAESGDSGQVGRGNNVAGFIPLTRPVSAEADAGKNAYSHIGKLYNRAGFDIADKIYKELGEQTYIWIVSRIGDDVKKPYILRIKPQSVVDIKTQNRMFDIAQDIFENLDKLNLFDRYI